MSQKYLEYSLVEGHIHNWLVVGPHAYQEGQGLCPMPIHPIERDPLQIDGREYRWKYFRCEEDHLTHFTTYTATQQFLKAWAYCILKIPEPGKVVLVVETSGPLTIWMNDEVIFQQTNSTEKDKPQPIPVDLVESNEILVELSGRGIGESALNFSLRISEPGSEELLQTIKIQVPTKARFPHRFQALEKLLEHAYLEDIVHCRGDHFNLRWNEDIRDESLCGVCHPGFTRTHLRGWEIPSRSCKPPRCRAYLSPLRATLLGRLERAGQGILGTRSCVTHDASPFTSSTRLTRSSLTEALSLAARKPCNPPQNLKISSASWPGWKSGS